MPVKRTEIAIVVQAVFQVVRARYGDIIPNWVEDAVTGGLFALMLYFSTNRQKRLKEATGGNKP